MRMIKQKGFATWVGAIKSMLLQTAFYLSLINFGLLGVTAYNTTIASFIEGIFPWMNMGLFLAGMVLVILLLMFVEYKFVYPAMIKFQNEQEYEHKSLLRRDISELKDQIKELKMMIGK